MSDVVSFPQAVSHELIAKLVKAGYLEPGLCNDAVAVANAIARLKQTQGCLTSSKRTSGISPITCPPRASALSHLGGPDGLLFHHQPVFPRIIHRAVAPEKQSPHASHRDSIAVIANRCQNVRPGHVNPIVTITPSQASPGSHRLAICAENREVFASVVLEPVSYTHLTLPTKRIV